MRAKAAQLQVEALEDRLAPTTSTLPAALTKPALPPGTVGFDRALPPSPTPDGAPAGRPRGFAFNPAGPIQTMPATPIVAIATVIIPARTTAGPAALAMDPGGSGWLDLASLLQAHEPTSIIHTSFWQSGAAVPDVDNGALDELIHAKQHAAPPVPTPDASPAKTPGAPASPQWEPSETAPEAATQPVDTASRHSRVDPAARTQLVCRLVMQARPGHLIAVVLVLSWTACERNPCRETIAGRRARRRAGLAAAETHPAIRPRPARAPPVAEPDESAWQNGNGRPRGLPFLFARHVLSLGDESSLLGAASSRTEQRGAGKGAG